MRLSGNSYIYIGILVIMVFVILWSVFAMKHFESRLLPILFGGFVFMLAAIGLINEVAQKNGEATTSESSKGEIKPREEHWRGYLVNGAWVVGFVVAIFLLGFVIAIPLFVFAYMKRLGAPLLTAIIWAILTPVAVYLAFDVALDIDLHPGLLLSILGE